MQTLDLNAYGVSEMTKQEMVETNGGWIPIAIKVGKWALRIGGALSSAGALVHCAKGCASGIQDGFNE